MFPAAVLRWAAAAAAVTVMVVGHAVSAVGPAPSVLVAPASYGVVDFGDRVAYELSGAGCLRDQVRVDVTAGHRVASGAVSSPLVDPLRPGNCAGVVLVPGQLTVEKTGWRQGDPIAISVVARHSQVQLRYLRVEVAQGKPAAGNPTLLPAHDPRSPATDRAVEMSSGDTMDIGRVDLTKVNAISIRACLTGSIPARATPIMFSLRENSPTGPALVGPRDIASDIFVAPWNSDGGWDGCWFLEPSQITGVVDERAPELFVSLDASPLPVLINFIDFNGTGAKLPDVPPRDPPGSRVIFDGRSFHGWSETGCAIRDKAARTASYPNGCAMTYTAHKLHNVVIRLAFRFEDFNDNGGILVGGTEIQMREAGEWLVGGYYGQTRGQSELPTGVNGNCNFNFQVMWTYKACGYPANMNKVNVFPDWNQMEIVQLGAHYIVRVNGRTVTDAQAVSDPAPYNLQLITQPEFAFHYALGGSFQQPYPPTVQGPDSWGNIWYSHIRVYPCASLTDPVCTRDDASAEIG